MTKLKGIVILFIKRIISLNWASYFWLTLTIFIAGFCFLIAENQILFLTKVRSIAFWSLLIVVTLIYSVVINFVFAFKANLSKEKINNQHSWIFYYFFALISSPLVSFIINKYVLSAICLTYNTFCYRNLGITLIEKFPLNGNNNLLKIVYWIFNNNPDSLLIRIVILGLGLLYFLTLKTRDLSTSLRFAAGSVGSKDDDFNFNIPARNIANNLKDTSEFVTVAALYGDMGYGKSSFARMVVENIERKDMLYTYISLTETNEAKDFSLLFSERWLESLQERYPKINIIDGSFFLSSLLRESGYGVFSEFFSFLTKMNKGLTKTKSKYNDQFIDIKSKYVTSNIAQLFGNVPEFKEKLWLIMVDEIERARLDEIYKLIETIERFKSEGRTGLPVKIVFLLCISKTDLETILEKHTDNNKEIAKHIENFLFDDPKNITRNLYLPPVSYKDRKKNVISLIKPIMESYSIKTNHKIESYEINLLFDPDNRDIREEDAMGYILGKLSYETPRVIQRCIQEVNSFYLSFINKDGIKVKNYIRFADILIASYVRVQYPYLIDFFVKTLRVINLQLDDQDSVSRYLERDSFKENKRTIHDWITEVTSHKFETPKEKREAITLIGFIANNYLSFVKEQHGYDKSPLWKLDSLSDPDNLQDYLGYIAAEPESPHRINYEIYKKHIRHLNEDYLSKLSNEELIEYAKFLRVLSGNIIYTNFEAAVELYERFAKIKGSKPIPIQIFGLHDTMYNSAIYEFLFNILAIKESNLTKQLMDEYLRKSLDLIKKFLKSDKILTGGKYIFLNSLINNEIGGGDGTHFRLSLLYEDLKKLGGIDKEICYVFEEADSRYFSGNQDIYVNEENFFYVLYQSWSGNSKDINLLTAIRKAAINNLNKHPRAFQLYWELLYYKENASFDEIVNSFAFNSSSNLEVYAPLTELVKVSKKIDIKDSFLQKKIEWWKTEVANNPEHLQIYKNKYFKEANDTLKSFVVRAGYIKEN
ncbi:MAG: hypothetical protein WC775_03690 [Patescibacteria group bacterium]|jgi:dephospho-CoA kinase